MDIADEIAYGVHDFEDGVALHFVSRDHWANVGPSYDAEWAKSVGLPSFDQMGDRLFASGPEAAANRKRAIGGLVNALISSVRLAEVGGFQEPVLNLRAMFDGPAKKLQKALQDVNSTRSSTGPACKPWNTGASSTS